MPRKSFFPRDPVIPSRVKNCLSIAYRGKAEESEDEDYSEDDDGDSLFLPFVKELEHREKIKYLRKKNILKEQFGGKWMMFFNNKTISLERGMTHQDYMWQFVKPLVDNSENTGITSAHCSTGNPFPYGTDPRKEDGLICCFTNDYRNKFEVKKAAEAIRQVLYYPDNLYYKTDEATIFGVFKYFGHKFVCLYKHTPDYKLYERDEKDPSLWNLVKFEA